MLASLAFLQSSQRSFELRSAALDVYLFASHVVARSVELNGNVFVLDLAGNHDVDVQHGGGVEGDVAALER